MTYDRTDKSENKRCAQCGSQTPAEGFTTKKVIHRDRVNGRACVSESTFTVCSGTACGSYLQMAHEG